MYNLEPIGIVRNEVDKSIPPKEIKRRTSIIEVNMEYSDGLFKIEDSEYIQVLFVFHQVDKPKIKGPVFSGEVKGIFASRSPRRPNKLGSTVVKLLKREGNKLFVLGLDALNETPVVDIKPIDDQIFKDDLKEDEIYDQILKSNPRMKLMSFVRSGETEQLLLMAAQMHGHFCPGLAMGVMAGTYALQNMLADPDGLEDILAVTETNNCFSDGIQFVTGCSFGNNALIFRDIGKTAFSLVRRNGKGIRIVAKDESKEELRKAFPEFSDYYQRVVKNNERSDEVIGKFKKLGIQRAFACLSISFEKLFMVEEVVMDIPEYAPSHQSLVCNQCKETTMSSRIRKSENGETCFYCLGEYYQLDGHGITFIKP